MLDAQTFARARSTREIRILARMLSVAENDPGTAYRILSEAVSADPALGADNETAGRDPAREHGAASAKTTPRPAHVIGVTGPPGVGKSTLVSALISEFRANEQSVAVLAVDPSSPFRGGALLGDRIRMNAHAGDPGVYIRSMATRGVLGGLSRAAWLAVRVLSVWGFDWVLIETAGVGQSEIDVVDLAETTVLVLSPAVGDDVQVMKAGIMEVANLFVINKADLPGAERMRNSLRSVLERNGASDQRLQSDEEPNHSDASGEQDPHAGGGSGAEWPEAAIATPDGRAIFDTVATEARSKSGVPELAETLANRNAALHDSDRLEAFRARRHRIEIRRLALSLLGTAVEDRLRPVEGQPSGTGAPASLVTDPLETARRIVQELVTDETWRQIDVHTD